mgnify:CR=1 FL=1
MQGKSLRKFLGDCIYIMQDYQRGYSWEDRHLDDLYQDILSLNKNQKHYSGTIVLRSTPSDLSQYSCASLVDGQQRLTTLMIIISTILAEAESREIEFLCGERIGFLWSKFIFSEIKGSKIFYLKSASAAQNEFLSIIINNGSLTDKKTKLKIYHKKNSSNAYQFNMMNALSFFNKEIQRVTDEQLEKIFDATTNKLIFNVLEVEQDFDECSMFESINYRGKKITVFEGVKNRLIQICNQNGISGMRAKINSVWAEIYEILGSSKTILDEDEFLSCHTMIYYGSKGKGSLEDFLLKNKFSTKNISASTINKTINLYTDSILMGAKCWGHMKRVKKITIPHLDQKSELLLDKIHCLEIPSHFNPIILSALMVCAKKTDDFDYVDINNLLEQVERYCFIYYKLISNRSNFNSKIQGISTEILEEDIDVSDATEKILELIDSDKYSNAWDDYSELHKTIAREAQARFMAGDGWTRWPSIKYVMVNYFYFNEGSRVDFKKAFEESKLCKIYRPDEESSKEEMNIFNDIGNIHIIGVDDDLCHSGNPKKTIISRGQKIIEFIFDHWDIPRDTQGTIQVDLEEFLSSGVKRIKES